MTEETNQSINENKEKSAKGKNTGMAIVAYIIFFIPLLTDVKKDPFVKYHIKQGLVLFIGWILVSIIGMIIPWQFGIITTLLNICMFVLMVVGIMSAAKGEQRPLPIIGKFGEQFKF